MSFQSFQHLLEVLEVLESNTVTGITGTGVEFSRKICGVSIIRSGEAMENALRTCCSGVPVASLASLLISSQFIGDGREAI